MMKRYGGHGPIAAKGSESGDGGGGGFEKSKQYEMVHVVGEMEDSGAATSGEAGGQVSFVDVLVPAGYGPGAFLTTTDPNTGNEMTVTVPEGVWENQSFRVELVEVLATPYVGEDAAYADQTTTSTDYVVDENQGVEVEAPIDNSNDADSVCSIDSGQI